MTDTPTPPEGWYPDPAGSGGTRRWDGTAWTDDVRPAGATQADAVTADAGEAPGEREASVGEPSAEAVPRSDAAVDVSAADVPVVEVPATAEPDVAPPVTAETETPAAPAPTAPSAPTAPVAPTAAPAAPTGAPAYSSAPGYAAAAAAPGYAATAAAVPGHPAAPGHPAVPGAVPAGGAPGYPVAPTGAATPARPDASTDTIWVWLIVALPLVQLIALFLFDWRSLIEQTIYTAMLSEQGSYSSSVMNFSLETTFLGLGASLLGLLIGGLSVLFAFLDWRQLRARGIQKPFHWAWAFFVFVVTAGVYVIGRGIVLRRQTGKGLGPVWGFIGVTAVSIVITTIWAVILMREVLSLIQQIAYYYSY
ncbi:MAG: PPE-repeat protein [Microbacterium sp.]|jgi:hypothetical protein|nr:PPE-repeat protein [Microbacterium sp.]